MRFNGDFDLPMQDRAPSRVADWVLCWTSPGRLV